MTVRRRVATLPQRRSGVRAREADLPELSLTSAGPIAYACFAAFVAGFVRGFTGFGGAAVMSLILTLAYPPATVIPKVLLIDLAGNVPLLHSTVRLVEWRKTTISTIAGLVALPIGIYALLTLDAGIVKKFIAGVVAACAVAMLRGVRFKREPSDLTVALVGAVSGAVLGATYVAMVVMIFFLAAPGRVDVSRANGVFWLMVTNIVMAAAFVAMGAVAAADLPGLALVCLVYIGTTYLGARGFRLVRETTFRRLVLWILIALATVAMLR
ncbi:MAG: sulfite exporter TauE/SafE family protein [Alphaproteobacteria bacterium]|nr:sulfite exporter TauE/SafE family protein [Alphaproteobacteria bacterium]